MQKQSLFQYYWFGTCIRYLQDAREGWVVGSMDDSQVRFNVDRLLETLDEFGLRVTSRAAFELRRFDETIAQFPDDHRLTAAEASELSTTVTHLRRTLEAEIHGLSAFLVTPKRHAVDVLSDDFAELMSPGVFARLPAIARFDLQEAGRCIVFERPTAAAFHLMRATEAVLREFYKALVKRNRVDLMWGPIVADLRKRKKLKAHETLLNHLDNIRQSFRNPTQHPDKVYDVHEAQDLLGLVIDVMSRMAPTLSSSST